MNIGQLKQLISKLPNDMLIMEQGHGHEIDTTFLSVVKVVKEGRVYFPDWDNDPKAIEALCVGEVY